MQDSINNDNSYPEGIADEEIEMGSEPVESFTESMRKRISGGESRG